MILILILKKAGKYAQRVGLFLTNIVVKQMAIKDGELIRQFNFIINTFASVKYSKFREDDDFEKTIDNFLPAGMNIPLTKIELYEPDVMTKLVIEIQRQEMDGSEWNFQVKNCLKIFFNKTHALNGRTYAKIPIRTNSILNNLNKDTYCFLWSISASIHPINNYLQRVSNYMSYQNELNITSIDFINGMKITDTPRFETLNPTKSINVFENFRDEDNDYKLDSL